MLFHIHKTWGHGIICVGTFSCCCNIVILWNEITDFLNKLCQRALLAIPWNLILHRWCSSFSLILVPWEKTKFCSFLDTASLLGINIRNNYQIPLRMLLDMLLRVFAVPRLIFASCDFFFSFACIICCLLCFATLLCRCTLLLHSTSISWCCAPVVFVKDFLANWWSCFSLLCCSLLGHIC